MTPPHERVSGPPGRARITPACTLVGVTAGLFLVLAQTGRAQAVAGRVIESPGKRPIADVEVRLFRAAPGDTATPTDTTPVAVGMTASDGVFALIAPGTGTYRVRVASASYGPPITLASADSVDQREYAIELDYGAPFLGSQVDREAASVPGTFALHYPAYLQSNRVTGCAALQFVVDTVGRVDSTTIQAVALTRLEFAQEAARAAVKATYKPAERGGRKVRQVVREPFAFTLEGGAPPDMTSCKVAAPWKANAAPVRGYERRRREVVGRP